MELAVSFSLSVRQLAGFHHALVEAAQLDVPGRWQPEPVAAWCDAWSNLSSCLDMAEGRAAHAGQHDALESLRSFHLLLLRAMRWSDTLVPLDEQVTLQCQIVAGDNEGYQRYEEQVRGYHYDEFSAAITDAGNLVAALLKAEGFEREIQWLQLVRSELLKTQESMLHGWATGTRSRTETDGDTMLECD